MVVELARYIPHLVVGLLALALLTFLLSLHQLRRGRTGPYWRLRRAAGQRGGQLFLLSVTLLLIALVIAFFSGLAAVAVMGVDRLLRGEGFQEIATALAPSASPTPTDMPTPTPSSTSTDTPTPLPTPTAAPTSTVTAAATGTRPPPTPTLALTPSPTFETALNLQTFPDARLPRPGATIAITAADSRVSESGTPVEPRTTFGAGVRRIYLFVDYRELDNGVAWSFLLYRDSVAVQGSTRLWSLGEAGSSFFFFGDDMGYPPGEYRAEIRLGDQIVSEFSFTILGNGG